MYRAFRGIFRDIKKNSSTDAGRYKATIGFDEVGIHDPEIAKALKTVAPGTEIEYAFHDTGDAKVLTHWRRIAPATPGDNVEFRRANEYAERASALAGATLILGGYTSIRPRQKAELVLRLARQLERYVHDGVDDTEMSTLFEDIFREIE